MNTKVYLGIGGDFLIGEEVGTIGANLSKSGNFTNRITAFLDLRPSDQRYKNGRKYEP